MTRKAFEEAKQASREAEQQETNLDTQLLEADLIALELDRSRLLDSNCKLRHTLKNTLDSFDNSCEEFVDFRNALSQMRKGAEDRMREALGELAEAKSQEEEATSRLAEVETANQQLQSQLSDSQHSMATSRQVLTETIEKQEES